MKNIFKIFLLATLVFTVGCENEDDPRFQANSTFGWMEFPTAETTVAVTPRSTTVSIPFRYTAPVNASDVTVNYSINIVSGVDPTNVVTGLGSNVTIAANTNRLNLELTFLSNAVSTLISGGDAIFDIEITSTSGGVPIGLADGSATTAHRVNLLCGGEPAPGIYTIDMHDSFGDGWQTDDGNGGSGLEIVVTDLDGSEMTFEVGMCSPYTGSNLGLFTDESLGLCTGPASLSFFDATTTIEMPATTVGAVWNWPGDQYGEISFEIYNPDGSLLYATGPGLAAVELPVSYCQ